MFNKPTTGLLSKTGAMVFGRVHVGRVFFGRLLR
jgi:hypothetical protein